MDGKSILFFDPDKKVCRVAARALNATRSEVTVTSDLGDLITRLGHDSPDLVMVCYDESLRQSPLLLKALDRRHEEAPETGFVLHTTEASEDYMPVLQSRPYIHNHIAKNEEPLEPSELIVTATKLLRGDLFGVEKYLMWGVEPLKIGVRRSIEKPRYVEEIGHYADALGCNQRTIELVEGIVDELVTNAIFNAPVDPDGKARYRHLRRSAEVELADNEVATLSFACDGDYIVVSTRDPFGSLGQDTVIEYLNRCLVKGPRQISEESGGAGIGLYRVFQSASKFVINLEAGVSTEVMCLIDLRLSMKQFRLAAKSFHIFAK